ncbi:MAG: hypothetical protein HUU45_10735, partial [Leptospiraceae bacterium]|nr:hypothetical protein [Leptospiraceae bacterium]
MTQEIVKFIKRFNIVNRIRAKYLIVTPLFYSFGDACEQIYWALARANLLDKKLMIIPPFKFTQLLLYKISNNEVFRLEFNYYENNFEKLLKFFIAVYINLEFFIVR